MLFQLWIASASRRASLRVDVHQSSKVRVHTQHWVTSASSLSPVEPASPSLNESSSPSRSYQQRQLAYRPSMPRSCKDAAGDATTKFKVANRFKCNETSQGQRELLKSNGSFSSQQDLFSSSMGASQVGAGIPLMLSHEYAVQF